MYGRTILVSASLLCLSFIAAYAADKEPWYMKDPKPATLKAALAESKNFLGADNPGYGMKGDRKMCAVLRTVGLPCDYNTRGTLSLFLTVNGRAIFPVAGGTNPYWTVRRDNDPFPDDAFVGEAKQNAMLADAIKRNRHLFKGGDLTAEAVQNHWR